MFICNKDEFREMFYWKYRPETCDALLASTLKPTFIKE